MSLIYSFTENFLPILYYFNYYFSIRGGLKISENEIDSTLKKVLVDFGGKEALIIAKILIETTNEDLTDERIAELSVVKLNIVRKILYILNENKLTEFQRVRDKRSGWYIYYWKETFGNLPNLLSERKDHVVNQLDIRMRFENENFFFTCNNSCTGRYIFIDAMDLNFRCPNCDGGVLAEEKNKEKVKFLKDTIINIRNV